MENLQIMVNKQTETQLHIAIADYLRLVLPECVLWYHVPNGARRNIIDATLLKRMGVMAGIPDLVIMWAHQSNHVKGYEHLVYDESLEVGFIEIKTPKGVLSPNQKNIREKIEDIGAGFEIARSIEDVQNILNKWDVPRFK